MGEQRETRLYPLACTSAYCGNVMDCDKCVNVKALRAFKAWREETGATRPDHIWSPRVWVAAK